MIRLCLALALVFACGKSTKQQPPAAASGPVCVDGKQLECEQSGGKWTGALCCLAGMVTCTDGKQLECGQNGGKWTGALCCVN